jgi:acyl-CoA thioesterase
MGALQVDTAVRRDGERLVAELSRDWEIWGPNGGYVAAVALRAVGAVAPADHRPASMSVQYVGVGDFGEVECQVTPVKQGRNAWLCNVALRQKDRTFLQAQVWTTGKTDGPVVMEAVMPDVPAPATLKTYAEHARAHYGDDVPAPHGFWSNFEGKPLGWKPFEATREAGPSILHEWYSYVGYEPGDVYLDFARAVILLDTLIWPAHHRGLAAAPDYIAPSLDLTLWFHEPAGAAEWLLVDGVADAARAGLIHGHSRLWTDDGRLVATGGSNLLHTPRRA